MVILWPILIPTIYSIIIHMYSEYLLLFVHNVDTVSFAVNLAVNKSNTRLRISQEIYGYKLPPPFVLNTEPAI